MQKPTQTFYIPLERRRFLKSLALISAGFTVPSYLAEALTLTQGRAVPREKRNHLGGAREVSRARGQRTSFISPEKIDWIEADGNYAVLHVGGRSHLLRATMSALEAELPANFSDEPFVHPEPAPGQGAAIHRRRLFRRYE